VALTSDPATLAYGTSAKQKLSNPVIARGPEDQLKTPLDGYFAAMAELIGYHSRHGVATRCQVWSRLDR